ncbi:ANR family transcriptional regulator [Escherichia coli]|uniref:ANR family transcriptional regulator n=1 Tax=Escherichia coli TaxID=562 RepID=UPI001CDA2623|nr:ANR family transcriptional regulator [Escherichia coli]MCA2038556.1 ANR family transcriptional regulator [Escherichia coli]
MVLPETISRDAAQMLALEIHREKELIYRNIGTDYHALAEYAVSLEREQSYRAAYYAWAAALACARGVNVAWCEARMKYCGFNGGLISRALCAAQ